MVLKKTEEDCWLWLVEERCGKAEGTKKSGEDHGKEKRKKSKEMGKNNSRGRKVIVRVPKRIRMALGR